MIKKLRKGSQRNQSRETAQLIDGWYDLPDFLTEVQSKQLMSKYDFKKQEYSLISGVPKNAYFRWKMSRVLQNLQSTDANKRNGALTQLTSDSAGYANTDNKEIIADAGGIEIMTSILRSFSGKDTFARSEASTVRRILLILNKLSRHQEVRKKMMQNNECMDVLAAFASVSEESIKQLAAMDIANVIQADESEASMAIIKRTGM